MSCVVDAAKQSAVGPQPRPAALDREFIGQPQPGSKCAIQLEADAGNIVSPQAHGRKISLQPAPGSPIMTNAELGSTFPEALPPEGDMLVATLRGINSPTVTPTFLEAVQQADVPVRILDVAQYVVEGSLVLSLIFQFVGTSSIRMMQNLVETAKDLDMQLDFEFPHRQREAQNQTPSGTSRSTRTSASRELFRQISDPFPTRTRVVSVSLVRKSTIPVALLQGVFKFVAERGAKVIEVGQMWDNKIGWNGEFDRVGLKVSCPFNVPTSRLYLGLRNISWEHQCEVAVREFAAMNFPSAKSLIVFGLSDVLCMCNCLDELLREACVEGPKTTKHGKPLKPEALAAAKLTKLKGKPADIQQTVADRIPLTLGARFVCRALKDIGFRLAIITNSGGRFLAEKVKNMLGMDYAIAPEYGIDQNNCFTGQHAGDTGDLEMRKYDFLQLLADKEDIEPRDVIVVGRFMEGHDSQTVNEILDNFGPQIYFHARPHMDKTRPRSDEDAQSLTVLLYLLGFHGFDVQALYDRYEEQAQEGGEPADLEIAADVRAVREKAALRKSSFGGTRCLVRVHSNENNTKKFAELLEPLLPFQAAGDLDMLSSQLITIASGDGFLGLELVLKGENPKAPLKDLLFDSHQLRMDMDWDMQVPTSSTVNLVDQGTEPGRFIITLVKKPELTVSCLAATFRHCSDLEVECLRLDRLSWHGEFSALRAMVVLPNGAEVELRGRLLSTSQTQEVDIAFQRAGVERWGRRLIAFDMDNTLIQEVAVDELAKAAGAGDKAQQISERMRNGELDIPEALREKVLLLKGHHANRLIETVTKSLVYTHGARRLCRTLKRLGYKMALISGGILQVAREVQRELELDYAFANELEVDPETGDLTGCIVGPFVTPQRKRALLSRIADVEGCNLSQVVAVGDGVSDIPMLTSAGLGVAFCGKQQVQDVADLRVNSKDLCTVLFLIGLSEAAAVHFGRDKEREPGNDSEFREFNCATPPLWEEFARDLGEPMQSPLSPKNTGGRSPMR